MRSLSVLAITCWAFSAITAGARAGDQPAGSSPRPPTTAVGKHARFERLVALSWHLPFCPAGGSPWSPAGGLLAVDSAGRLATFDVKHPQAAPRILLALATPTNITVSWSPNGRWIACHTKTYSGRSAIGDSLWAVPVESGRPELVQGGSRIWPFVSGSDGFIYAYTRHGGAIMPSYGAQVTPQEAYDLINFIRSMQKKSPR